MLKHNLRIQRTVTERNTAMSNQYGPWATSIGACGNPQLSTFWRRRLTMLVPASQTSAVLSRQSLLSLVIAGLLTCALPTLREANTSAMAAEEPAPTAGAENTNGDEKALEEFNRLYALKEGEVWKHIAPPFSPARAIYFRSTHPLLAKDTLKRGPDMMLLVWRGGKLKNWGFDIGKDDDILYPLSSFVAIYPQDIEGDKELLHSSHIQGDWVFREGTPKKQAVAELGRILNEKCNLPVKLTLRDVERKVFVATGEFKFHPISGHSGKTKVYVYDKNPGTPETQAAGGGNFERFIRDVGTFIDTRIVSDLKNPPKDNFDWCFGDGIPYPPVKKQLDDRDSASVLKHVTEQTGVTFREETRTVPVLFVERAK